MGEKKLKIRNIRISNKINIKTCKRPYVNLDASPTSQNDGTDQGDNAVTQFYSRLNSIPGVLNLFHLTEHFGPKKSSAEQD